MSEYDCFEGGRVSHEDFEVTPLLEDTHWSFSLKRCIRCDEYFLHAFLENDGYSHSGRWVMGRVPADFERANPNDQELLAFLYGLPRLFVGGSYWKSTGLWADRSPNHPVYNDLKRWIVRAE